MSAEEEDSEFSPDEIKDEVTEASIEFEDPNTILDRIKDVKESQKGEYTDFVDEFHILIEKMKRARIEYVPYDSVDSSITISELINSSELHNIFSCFRGIYEFIIHLHKVYDVKLNAGTPKKEDEQLCELLEVTIRKYTSECRIMTRRNTHLTISIQFILV
jgi:hypothetical protein